MFGVTFWAFISWQRSKIILILWIWYHWYMQASDVMILDYVWLWQLISLTNGKDLLMTADILSTHKISTKFEVFLEIFLLYVLLGSLWSCSYSNVYIEVTWAQHFRYQNTMPKQINQNSKILHFFRATCLRSYFVWNFQEMFKM